ncbi:MAG: hypothetical protein HYT68_00250, partial [Candidatus Zambryskibacteria bacterium]|nr:hypothetical protein [Candidatus Zambryskibacteria bacterium]
MPDANNTRNLGSGSLRWATGYFDTVDATTLSGTVSGGSTSANTWTINSDNATNNAEVGSLAFETGTATFNANLNWNAAGDAGRVSGYDNTFLTNYPIAIYSEVSGANQTFTSG